MSTASTVQIGGHCLGGAVGEYPTAVLGTLFFTGQKLLADCEKGEFDERAAAAQIHRSAEAAGRAGIPLFLDIVAETQVAMNRYLEFVIRNTSLPFLIDGSSEEVRLTGLNTAREFSALHRSVYNSINTETSDGELKALVEAPPASIIISAIDTLNFGLESSLSIVRKMKEDLPAALHNHLLADIGFLDEASVKLSARLARSVREETGLPVGGAPCNGLYMWNSLKDRGETAFQSAFSATIGYVLSFGLDFLFIGPLRNVERIAPAVGAANVYNRYELQSLRCDLAPADRHPIKAMFG